MGRADIEDDFHSPLPKMRRLGTNELGSLQTNVQSLWMPRMLTFMRQIGFRCKLSIEVTPSTLLQLHLIPAKAYDAYLDERLSLISQISTVVI